MKRKVGIITINDNGNYGNRLQNFALQEILRYNCVEVETIKNYKISNINKVKRKIGKKIKFIRRKRIIKSSKFEEFNKKIIYSKYKIVNGKIPKRLRDNYDIFIVGSDQVWNPYFDRLSSIDLLEFAYDYQKVSYAASFGVDNIPESNAIQLKKNLESFKAISVRENEGKDIINRVGINNVEVVLDPTMLISKNKWELICTRPYNFQNEKYIFCYFLGSISTNRMNSILEYAKMNNCKVINIMDKEDVCYFSGPQEFLYLIKNSYAVFTDSFHACVFSIIFQKNFLVFSREDNLNTMNSRITTLLSIFDLDNNIITDTDLIVIHEINYDSVNGILEKEKVKSLKFLLDSIK